MILCRVSFSLQLLLLVSYNSGKNNIAEAHPWKKMSSISSSVDNHQPQINKKVVELVNINNDADNDDDPSDSTLDQLKPLVVTNEGSIPRGGGGKVEEQGKSTILSSVFNLVNNVAGAGILTLSSGMAGGTGWIPAIIICSILGALSGHCFAIIGEACEMTGEMDFKGLWSRTIGEKSTYLVDTMIAFMCLAAAVIYSGILGDVFTPLLAQAGFPSHLNGRTSNILAITGLLLLPLSLVKDLSALAFTSILGFAAIMYTVLFICIRAIDGSYNVGSGRFVLDGTLAAIPAFEKTSLWNFDFTSLVLASNLGLAYIAHYNAPNFYRR